MEKAKTSGCEMYLKALKATVCEDVADTSFLRDDSSNNGTLFNTTSVKGARREEKN